ncbi:MAG TPA: ATP-binding protein [Candidatus Angelobacter sp.]|jgi:signal transduction histidine kinase|nr:ATP-binding protein [Candidatus Angelobacter sp.]
MTGLALILILALLFAASLLLTIIFYRQKAQAISANRNLEVEIAELMRAREQVKKLNATLENQLREVNLKLAQSNAELLALNQELESMSYSISHDLRAPLRAISGFSTIVLEDAADKLPAESKADLERVRDASRQMSEMIEGIVQLARISSCTIHREPVDLSKLASEIIDRLRKAEPARQVDVAIIPGLTARGDRALLQKMLENILDNAWKFTSKRQDTRIELGIQNGQGHAQPVYFVRDNGAGFDPRYAGKLFSPFRRLHLEKDFSGLGIGLVTVQRIIQRHGGRIWAESEVDKGATFYFVLEP